jgi:hypothetical protein
VDVYGTGPDLQEVQQAACSSNLKLKFNGPRNHADSSLQVGRLGWFLLLLHTAVQPAACHPASVLLFLCGEQNFKVCPTRTHFPSSSGTIVNFGWTPQESR